MSPALRELAFHLGLALDHARRLLGTNYKVTIIARYTKGDLDDADIMLGNDDLEAVAGAIEKLRKRPEFPG